MGHCCTSRCPNVAHGWQMGWYPLQQIDASQLKPGTTIAVKIAPGATQAKAPLVQGVRLIVRREGTLWWHARPLRSAAHVLLRCMTCTLRIAQSERRLGPEGI